MSGSPSPLRSALLKARKPIGITLVLCVLFALGASPLMAAVADPDHNAKVQATHPDHISSLSLFFLFLSFKQRLLVLVTNFDGAGSGPVGTAMVNYLQAAAAGPYRILGALPNYELVTSSADELVSAVREGHAWAAVWANAGATSNLAAAVAAAEAGAPLTGYYRF